MEIFELVQGAIPIGVVGRPIGRPRQATTTTIAACSRRRLHLWGGVDGGGGGGAGCKGRCSLSDRLRLF